MGLLDIFTRAEPDRKPSEAPPQPRAVFYRNRSGKPVVVYDNFCAAKAALQHPIVQRAIVTVARAVQQVDFYAEQIPGDTPVADGIITDLNDLLASPNNDYTGSMLKFWLGLSLSVYGKAGMKIGMGTRSPNGIYPLDAEFLRVVLNSRGRIDHYLYGMTSKEEKYPVRNPATPQPRGWASSIITPTLSGDLTDTKNTVYPLRAIGNPAKIIDLLMQRTLATAAGATNAKIIITTESNLTEEQLDEIDDYIESHDTFGSRSGETIFLRDTKVTVHELPSDLADLHTKMPADDMARLIFGAFGIPISLAGLGAADGAKFSGNYSESRAAFYMDTIAPGYLTPIANGLTKALCPAGARIVYDLDSIPAIQMMRVESMAKLKDVDFLTVSEKRQMFGWPAEGGPRNEG